MEPVRPLRQLAAFRHEVIRRSTSVALACVLVFGLVSCARASEVHGASPLLFKCCCRVDGHVEVKHLRGGAGRPLWSGLVRSELEGQAAGAVLSGQHQPLGFLRLISTRCVTFAIPEAQERPVKLGQLARCRRVDDGLQEMWDVVRGRHAPSTVRTAIASRDNCRRPQKPWMTLGRLLNLPGVPALQRSFPSARTQLNRPDSAPERSPRPGAHP